MKILADTHILLWVLNNDRSLTASQKEAPANVNNEKFVSAFSFMELAIKISLRKLPGIETSLDDIINAAQNDGFTILPVTENQISHYNRVPLFDDHKDPFDRFLIATALCENMAIMSSDEKFGHYQSIVTVL